MIACSTLIPLQEFDLKIDGCVKQIEESKAQIVVTQDKLDKDSALLKRKLALQTKIQLRKREAESEMDDAASEIKNIQLKMHAAGLSPASYKALQKEIDVLEAKTSDAETRTLEDMEKLELLEADTEKGTAYIKKKELQLSESKLASDRFILGIRAEIDTLKTLRSQLSLKIDASLLEIYEELRRKSGGQVIHDAEAPGCPACGMGFADGFVNQMAKHDGAEECPYCGLLIRWIGLRDE